MPSTPWSLRSAALAEAVLARAAASNLTSRRSARVTPESGSVRSRARVRRIRSENSWTARAAPGVSPGTDAGASSTSASGAPRLRACATRCSTVTSPMPRAGTFTMRRSETSSAGLASTLR